MLVELDQLTWPRAQDLGPRCALALVPVGSTEQHGPHLPLCMDSVIAQAIAHGVATQLEDLVLVTPVINVGLSDHHVDFAGTITLTAPVFQSLVEAFVSALGRLNVPRVALLSGHGGNFASLGELARRMSQSVAFDVRAYDDLGRFLEVLIGAAERNGYSPDRSDLHAGLLETSLALSLLGQDRVGDFNTVSGHHDLDGDLLERVMADGVRAISPTGVLGEPCGATEALGEQLLDAVVADVTEWAKVSFASADRNQ